MQIAVVGKGGREHALADVLGRHHDVLVTPGNPWIPGSTSRNIFELARDGRIDLVVIGSENDLVDGQADQLRELGVAVLGPGADGARLEGSKIFMKEVVEAAGVPTAEYMPFGPNDVGPAIMHARLVLVAHGKVVIKTDYLKGGKGVLVTSDYEEAKADIQHKLQEGPIIIEEPLEGCEVSVFAVTDGMRSICLPAAQDYKRLLDGDEGPNTGGMGAYSPVPFLPDGFEEAINRNFIQPTLHELRKSGINYRGVLYAGLMLTDNGPKLLEYNIRFGDPDSQVVLWRLDPGYDLTSLLYAAAIGDMSHSSAPRFIDQAAVLTVLAASGYPQSPQLGQHILGVPTASNSAAVEVLYAGVDQDEGGHLVVAGGRALNILGTGADLEGARERVYRALQFIGLADGQFRRDIGIPH